MRSDTTQFQRRLTKLETELLKRRRARRVRNKVLDILLAPFMALALGVICALWVLVFALVVLVAFVRLFWLPLLAGAVAWWLIAHA